MLSTHEILRERERIRLPGATAPMVIVVVDTEEEFDWGAGFDRNATSVVAMREIGVAQKIFDEYGIIPTYVVDYPVASQRDGYLPLKEHFDDGRAVIGAHLHSWVNPPHEEAVTPRNSYQANLDPELERRKLEVLAEAIGEAFGRRPKVHKAGRYGFGPGTADSLARLSIDVDLSAAPAFDYRGDCGPDYRRIDADAFWFNRRRLLGVPTTGAFIGSLSCLGSHLHRADLRSTGIGRLLAGGLSKSQLLERLQLSPEGYSVDELRRLTRSLLARGVRVFTFSFHSPSLKPGCTNYTPRARDVSEFLDRFRRFFDFFFGEVGGVATTPLELRDRLTAGDLAA